METIESAIFQEVAWRGPLKFEELLSKLPAYSWNQIFAAVDRLSRDRRLSLKRANRGSYVVGLGPRWEAQWESAVYSVAIGSR